MEAKLFESVHYYIHEKHVKNPADVSPTTHSHEMATMLEISRFF